MKKIAFLLAFYLITFQSWAKIDKIRAVYLDNPSYSITIEWVQVKGKKPALYFDSEQDWKKDSCLNQVKVPYKDLKYKRMHHFFVKLDHLQPDTKYYFQIKDSEGQSRVYWFKTLPDTKDMRLSIVAGGDSRSHREIRRLANLMVRKLQPDFVIFDGDFTMKSSASEWKKWLDDWQLTISDDGHIIPLLIVQGNHEQDIDMQKIFDVPARGYYSLTIGKNFMQIFALNTQLKIPGEQTQWFVNELKNSRAGWKVVAYHKPMRPHFSGKKEGLAQIRNWAYPIYDYGVQLVLEGDTHTCKWTYPIKPDTTADEKFESFVRDDEKGTVYVGEGTWGAPLRPADDIKPWTRDAEMINQFKIIFVTGSDMQIRTILYENANEVEQNSFDNRFNLPKGTRLWQPKNGSVLTIKR